MNYVVPRLPAQGRMALVPQADILKAADPGPDIRFGMIIAVFFFVGLLGWASLARLDAAAIAPGRLVVSGQRQTVQHPEGGIVSDILVTEGAKVRQGQVLIRLSGAEVRAQERALASQVISLLAQKARLQAEATRRPAISAPPEFASLTGEDRADAVRALQVQQGQLRTRAAVLAAQRGVIGQRTSQASSQGRGYSSQVVAVNEQLRLITQELESLRSVAAKGFVSINRIRALERAKAELEGQRGQYSATVAQAGGLQGETRLAILEAQNTYDERIASELRDVENALAEARPKWAAAKDQLARIDIRAPATGTVVGLSVFTKGGVIAAQQKLMDIVPEKAPLTIEAKLSPADADDVRIGQKTLVTFATLHERSLPAVHGVVRRVSADALSDERTGESFYITEVSVPLSEMAKVHEVGGSHTLRPGIPVSVQIPLRKRTALAYALEPLTGAMRKSFKEH